MAVDDFDGLSVRVRGALAAMNCCSFEDVVKISRCDWRRVWNFGVRSLAELEDALAARGLALHEYDVPTLSDIEILKQRVDSLNRQITDVIVTVRGLQRRIDVFMLDQIRSSIDVAG